MDGIKKKMERKKVSILIDITAIATGTAFVGMSLLAKHKKNVYVYEDQPNQKNPKEGKKVVFVKDENDKENADGVKGHLETVGEFSYKTTFYDKYIKRGIDIVLSFGGLVVLSPIMGLIALAIKFEDPGPVLFTQKRVGRNKQYFMLHKFRSMKISAPHDVPTHQLEHPDQYITKVGKFIRTHSLDELPQIWDIFVGNMSVIGPRPALWNQDLLTAERDKYGANDVKPGLTGWAQINGRDELEIPVKAKYDGDYVDRESFTFDAKCFFKSVQVFRRDDSMVEGGTGELRKKQPIKLVKANILVVCQYYYPENFQITPICEQLVSDGYKVTVLTGRPNYPSGVIPDEYKSGHKDEYVNGVHVIRCYEVPRGKGILKLGLNYLSYLFAGSKRAAKLKDKFDLVFVYQLSPVFMGVPGIKYAKKYNVPLFLYCCDLWPESMKMYIKNENHPVFKAVKTISKKIYHSADLIAGQSSSFLPYLRETHNIPNEKLIYLPAFADDTYLDSDFTPEDRITDFLFLGNLGIAQNLIAVLTAIKKIKDIPGFRVHIVGDGTCLDEMKEYVTDNGLESVVKFYGRRPVEEMPKYYKLADVCLVSLKADNATGLTLPSKVQGYMAAGKPIIGMIDGSAKEVIDESKCGICVKAGDIDGLAKAMKRFIECKEEFKNCGENGRKYFKENFNKEIIINQLEETIDKLLRGDR